MSRAWDVPEQHRRVVRALSSGGPAIPQSLLRDIEALDAAAAAPHRPRTRPRLRVARPAIAGGVAVVMAIAIAVVLSLSGAGGPTTVEAAELSALSSEGPSPTLDSKRHGLLARTFAGVRYPDWRGEFGWRPAGQRTDELGGRRTATVFYRHTHHRIGYTVISGKAIEPPDDAERLTKNGLAIRRFRVGEQDVVTFRRNGRTCVLSGRVHDPDTLVKLAAWEADGRLTF